MSDANIKRLIAPVIAMLRHDVTRPLKPAFDKAYALEQLESVMEILNAPPITSVEEVDTEQLSKKAIQDLLNEGLNRRD